MTKKTKAAVVRSGLMGETGTSNKCPDINIPTPSRQAASLQLQHEKGGR